MWCSKGLGVVAIAAALAVSGCEQPAAPDLKLKAGYYRIVAERGSKALWHDYLKVTEDQAETTLERIPRAFQSRMAPSDNAASWQASDRPCKTSNAVVKGGTFSATGTCRIISKGKLTKFDFQGTAYGDAFKIKVTRSGFGTKTEGTPDEIVITGTFERN